LTQSPRRQPPPHTPRARTSRPDTSRTGAATPPTGARARPAPAVAGPRIRGSTPDRAREARRSEGRRRRAAGPGCSLLPAVPTRRREGLDELVRDPVPAHRAELRISGQRSAALRARDDRRRRSYRTSAVRAEVRGPDDRCPTRASRGRRGPSGRSGSREQRVQLLQTLVEREQLVAALDQEVLPELVAAE